MWPQLRQAIAGVFQYRSINGLRTRYVNLRQRGLHFSIDPERALRIVLVADIHARDDWFPTPLIKRLVTAINAVENTDFVALVGDFTGDDPSAMASSAQQYANINAPTVAVLGNHDHWAGPQYAEKSLTAAGVHVLTNRSLPLDELLETGSVFSDTHVVGIDSCWPRKHSKLGARPDRAFAQVPADAEAIVLGHEPFIATMHEQALHLAGHTHLGQARSPIFGDLTARMHMPRFSEPFPCRLYEVDLEPTSDDERPAFRTRRSSRFVYTTAGVGFSTAPFRFLCPPEIVVIDC